MKSTLVLIPVVALLTACGTTDPYQARADRIHEEQAKYVSRTIDQAPDWMIKVPTSEKAVYSAGTSVSGDYSMALHKANADAYGKICMTAGGNASQSTKIYRADTDESTSENSELVIRAACESVDLTGVEVKDKKVIQEGSRFRAYVLIALPLTDANVMRKAKDARALKAQTAVRAPEAFKELR